MAKGDLHASGTICKAEYNCPLEAAGEPHFKTNKEMEEWIATKYELTPIIRKPRGKEEKLQKNLMAALNNSINAYMKYGPRSSKKLDYLHGAIAKDIINQNKDIKVSAKGSPHSDKELAIEGKINKKDVDITIMDLEENIIGLVEVKFIMSSYRKNSNNYIENLMGATANLRENGYKVHQFLVFPSTVPVVKNNSVVRTETVKNEDIDKYRNLMNLSGTSKPNSLFLQLVDIWKVDSNNVFKVMPKKSRQFTDYASLNFSDENIKFLNDNSDYSNFIGSLTK